MLYSVSLLVFFAFHYTQPNNLHFLADHTLTMRAPTTTFLAALLLLLTPVMGSFLNVANKCGFPVYCSAARSDPPVGKLRGQYSNMFDLADL